MSKKSETNNENAISMRMRIIRYFIYTEHSSIMALDEMKVNDKRCINQNYMYMNFDALNNTSHLSVAL